MTEVILHVSGVDAFFDHAMAAARRIDAGDYTPNTPRVGFPSIEHLWAYMTPERWSLLRFLQEHGPTGVAALGDAIGRDVGAVEEDLGKLEEIGLVDPQPDGSVLVPWSRITVEASLAIAA
ncbi:HVO_A0114 family putative DNA-binding protein [Mangrovibrevibacter kandeliae]|uniref:HVO_A0114 family putative DNA-binding protein n=1 Tax=Mangrovibrevibacter kandeliae TaxID=2968473 RepID=UPI002117618B|nr:hypothetical protein [Aurantimonas sp. CSK15Z-1]MCQ8784354.1 hypothetical protein [Aurantimonas sp. CSK15Z-1]